LTGELTHQQNFALKIRDVKPGGNLTHEGGICDDKETLYHLLGSGSINLDGFGQSTYEV
jgi:hypothetical protein